MAFTTPGTAVAGEVLTAAFWNTNVRDNVNALKDETDTLTDQRALVFIASQSFTAASSVSFNNVFSATYANYLIVPNINVTSGGGIAVTGRLRVSGSDASGSNYSTQELQANGSSVVVLRSSAQTSFTFGLARPNRQAWDLLISNPFEARVTSGHWTGADLDGGGLNVRVFSFSHNLGTSYDGFTAIMTTTCTGTIAVFGVRE
jgi:hypothetical protein